MTGLKSRSGRVAAAACALIAAVAVLAGCSTGDDAVATGNGNQFVSPGGKTVIEYDQGSRRTIGDVTGEDLAGDGDVKFSDYADKVMVVNVWASWCPPCRTEFRDLEDVFAETKDKGVQFVGINFRDSRSSASDFVSDRKVPYPSIYDYGGASLAALGVPVGVVPTTMILDRQHRPAKVFLRAITADELRDAVLKVAAEGPATQ
ncbi:TlpA family protein disulfide reductase [Gordonia neofelifaecis]|uniref:Redoxin domain-containing protein n=1 Tax=Gordonia neofelifaecis NRRL B-59395 TaxID=644548 RepID=F1YIP9_9ACTN|nr:TlpA disulfide reductase family protein [Gordonia neofelifaecis]EGD55357.1 Redoxin domain-containing protein [Gordonia neofelifaecis NRRL B-59395]